MNNELLRSGISDEGCGCPEEEWVMFNTNVTIHLEPDGSGHAFYYTGDWYDEKLFQASSMPELREAASNHLKMIYGIAN